MFNIDAAQNDGGFWYIYRVRSTGNLYPLEIHSLFCRTENLVYEPDLVRGICAKGCPNYNRGGGCPPKAPKLEEIAGSKDPVWLIYSRFWSKFKPTKVAASRNSAIHWRFQNSILTGFLSKVGYELAPLLEGSFLSSGHCKGCAGKKCNFKLGLENCRNPRRRTFSMEACGINVVATISKLFKIKVHWYARGKVDIPYMIKCIAIFPGKGKQQEVNRQLLLNCINKLSSCYLPIGSSEYWQQLNMLV